MRIRTQCRACGLPFGAELAPGPVHLPCPNCAEPREAASSFDPADATTVTRCPFCDSTHFYRQRDVNRGLGCALVAVGAALVPWTYGLSLLALTVLDVVLYLALPESVVCYRCDTVYRDARPTAGQQAFDLLKHDVLKYGKSWEPNE